MALDDLWFALVSWLVIALILRMLGLHEDRDEDSRPIAELFRLLPAFSLALVVHFWLQLLAGPETDHARELFQSVFLGFLYLVLAFAFIPLVGRFNRTLGRAKTDKLLSVVFICGYVLPAWFQHRSDEKTHTIHASAVRSLSELQVGLRTRWVADIRAAGAHGPAGQTPPMLAVDHTRDGIVVSNLAGRDICLRVARVQVRDPQGTADRYQFDEFRNTLRCSIVRASGSLTLTRKMSISHDLPLEFRVGDFEHDEVGWWSDTALIDLEKEAERFGRDTSFLNGLSDSDLREETARLAEMAADAQRAIRWREDVEFWTSMRN